MAGGRINELRRDPDLIARPPHAAFHDVLGAQLLSDLLNIDGRALVDE